MLDEALDGVTLEAGSAAPQLPAGLPALPEITPQEAAEWLANDDDAISLEASAAYRAGHPAGAAWATRARLDRLSAALPTASRIVLFADDPLTAQLAAIDLAELGSAKIAVVPGGIRAWQMAGMPVVVSPNDPPDAERIDYLFWNHDRHAGNREAMQAYLRWETELPEQIAADGLAGFRLPAH